MEERPYYYSRNGTDILGPITGLELHQLYHERAIDATSLICQDGDPEWKLLDPRLFGIPSPPAKPQAPAKAPRSKKKKFPWITQEQLLYSNTKLNLLLICCFSALIGGGMEVHLHYVVFADTEAEPQSLLDILGSFSAAAIGIAFAGVAVSMAFPVIYRQLARAVGMVCFVVLFTGLRYVLLANDAASSPAPLPTQAQVQSSDPIVVGN